MILIFFETPYSQPSIPVRHLYESSHRASSVKSSVFILILLPSHRLRLSRVHVSRCLQMTLDCIEVLYFPILIIHGDIVAYQAIQLSAAFRSITVPWPRDLGPIFEFTVKYFLWLCMVRPDHMP